MDVKVIEGDLLDQDVDVIVNAWNRNIIPWWLLLPQGVSGAIKTRAGYTPFRELAKKGPIPLGGAVQTSAGRLPHKAIIHVAGISMLWRSSEHSIRESVRNAVRLAKENGFRSMAFPLIGAGTGGSRENSVLAIMQDELGIIDFDGEVRIVRYLRNCSRASAGNALPPCCRRCTAGSNHGSAQISVVLDYFTDTSVPPSVLRICAGIIAAGFCALMAVLGLLFTLMGINALLGMDPFFSSANPPPRGAFFGAVFGGLVCLFASHAMFGLSRRCFARRPRCRHAVEPLPNPTIWQSNARTVWVPDRSTTAKPRRRWLGLLLLPLSLPLGLIVCVPIGVMAAVAIIRGTVAEQRLRRRCRRKGRMLDWQTANAKLLAAEGTLIVEIGPMGPAHVWWTQTDLLLLYPDLPLPSAKSAKASLAESLVALSDPKIRAWWWEHVGSFARNACLVRLPSSGRWHAFDEIPEARVRAVSSVDADCLACDIWNS